MLPILTAVLQSTITFIIMQVLHEDDYIYQFDRLYGSSENLKKKSFKTIFLTHSNVGL